MKHTFYLLVSSCLLLFSCHSTDTIPNTDIDVARAFIKDIQQSNFKQAEKLLLREETNNQYFDRFEEHFKSRPAKELEQYRNSDIIINEMSNVSDSVTVVNYSNSFNTAEKNKIKVVRINGQWLVDLKYTFSGNL